MKASKQQQAGIAAGMDQLRTGAAGTEERLAGTKDVTPDAIGILESLINGDFSKFQESPGYQFSKDQALKMAESGAAARGGLVSGRTLKELSKYGSGLASQEYGNYFNQVGSLAQLASPYYSTYASMPWNLAQGLAGGETAMGQAKAAGTNARYSGIGGALDSAVGMMGMPSFGGFSSGAGINPISGLPTSGSWDNTMGLV
jgi:hypothetical protein